MELNKKGEMMVELLVKMEEYFGFPVKSLSGFARTITVNKQLHFLEEFPVEIMTELFIELGLSGDMPEAALI